MSIGNPPPFDKMYSCFVSPKSQRLTYEERAVFLHKAGFRKEGLVTAVALTSPESAGDPKAFLGYVKLPENSAKAAVAHVALWTASHSRVSLISFRALAKKLGAKLTNADVGLCQINWWWRQADTTMQGLTDPAYNAEWAYKISSSGKKFTPWVAYTKGYHIKYLPYAVEACRKLGYIK